MDDKWFKLKMNFNITLFLLCAWAMIFAIMPVPYSAGTSVRDTLLFINGMLFWALFIGSIVSIVFLIKKANGLNIQIKKRLSFLHFFSNGYAKAADIFLGVSFLAFIPIMIFADDKLYLSCLSIAFFFCALVLHCMFNSCIFNAMEKEKLNNKKGKNIKNEEPEKYEAENKSASYKGRHTKGTERK